MAAYTSEQLRAIDAQVAQVMGWNSVAPRVPPRHYTTDIADAWRCIDYMREREWKVDFRTYSDDWEVYFDGEYVEGYFGEEFGAVAHDILLAICLAFLAANGVEAAA